MLARRRGQIVAVSSLAGDRGLPGEAAYCASKAAVNVYLQSLRADLRGRGIRVTTVCPGFVQTEITPLDATLTPFIISADDAARRIARLIDRRRGGVHRFPRRMALLMGIVNRLPDFVLCRVMSH